MRFSTTRKFVVVAVAATLWAAPPVYSAERALEEVIVTARKREENLQQVPTSINVLTADALKDRQINNVSDLQSSIPNATLTESGGLVSGALVVFIRGIGNDPGFDQGVGVYLDDVFLQRQSGLLLDVYDVARIEVLKGPQGNLYGRNTIGGAIKYVTKEPTDVVEASIEGKIGSYNLRHVKASISGPLVKEKLYGGLGLSYKKRDGIQTNVEDGKKYWDADVAGIRGNLKWTPTENFTVKLGANYSRDHSAPRIPVRAGFYDTAQQIAVNSSYLTANPLVGFSPTDLNPSPGKDKVSTIYDYNKYLLDSTTLYLTLIWELTEQWTFKSVTSDRVQHNNLIFDFGGNGQQIIDTLSWVKTDDKTQEFQFNYSGDRTEAVFGAFYWDGIQHNPSVSGQYPRLIVAGTSIDNITKDDRGGKSYALYGNIDYDITDDWHASVGARYTLDKATFARENDLIDTSLPVLLDGSFNFAGFIDPAKLAIAQSLPGFTVVPSTTTVTHYSVPTQHKYWRNFSPSFKLSYDINPDTMAYASVSAGYKAGGFNVNVINNGAAGAPTFDPEKVRSYALGLKTTLFEGTLRFNTEVFYSDYTDKQLSYLLAVPTPNGGLLAVTDNAGKAHTQGVDAEISWLTPVDGLQLDLSVGYLEAQIDKYVKQFATNPGVTADTVGVDVADVNKIGFSPRWTVNTRLSYRFNVGEFGDMTLAGDVAYRTKSYTYSPADISSAAADATANVEHAIYNASAVFNTADNHWRFALEGKNLANTRVITNAFDLGVITDVGYNEPRTWAFSVGYRYN